MRGIGQLQLALLIHVLATDATVQALDGARNALVCAQKIESRAVRAAATVSGGVGKDSSVGMAHTMPLVLGDFWRAENTSQYANPSATLTAEGLCIVEGSVRASGKSTNATHFMASLPAVCVHPRGR